MRPTVYGSGRKGEEIRSQGESGSEAVCGQEESSREIDSSLPANMPRT